MAADAKDLLSAPIRESVVKLCILQLGVPSPFSEFMSFGYPHPRSGFRIRQPAFRKRAGPRYATWPEKPNHRITPAGGRLPQTDRVLNCSRENNSVGTRIRRRSRDFVVATLDRMAGMFSPTADLAARVLTDCRDEHITVH